MSKLLKGLIKLPIYLVVFFLPLFVLPFTAEVYEFPKLYLLFGLILLSLLGWFGKMVLVERSLVFRKTPLDLAIAFLFLGALVATIFSRDLTSSLLGFYGRFSGGFIELLLWIAFYFVITNNFTYLQARRLFLLFFSSAFLVGAWFHLSYWGLFQKIPFPFITSFVSFIPISPIGISPQALGVFEALALYLLLLFYTLYGKKGPLVVLGTLAFLLFLSVVLMVNFQASWLILFLSLVLFFLGILRLKILPGSELNRLSPIIFTGLIALVFLLFPSLGAFFNLPGEILLTHRASWQIVWNALTTPPFTLIGTGLGNFFSTYNLFRPLDFNQTLVWASRFDTGASYFANLVATMGVIGILSLGLFVGFVFYLVWKLLKEEAGVKREAIFYGASLIGILVSLGFYYQPISLSLMFWLTLAPLALLLGSVFSFKEYRYEFGISAEANLFLTSLVFVGVFVVALLGYFGGRFYRADVLYRRALVLSDIDKQLATLGDAVRLNPFRIEYRIALAQSSLEKVTQEVRKVGPGGVSDISPLAVLTAQAVDQAQQIIVLAPQSVIAWENRASVYRDLRGLVSGEASRFALVAFEEAQKLEPTNPVFPAQISRLWVDENNLQKAKEFITKAKELKPDYINIQLVEALILEKQGKEKEAVGLLDAVVSIPNLPPTFLQDTLFHLGRIAYNAGQIQKSIDALERIIELNPTHSNARYALGLAYERQGRFAEAKAEYKRVLELNPGNQEVKARLEQL